MHDCGTERAAALFRCLLAADVFGIGYVREGRVVDANGAFATITGADTVDLVLGIPLDALLVPGGYQTLRELHDEGATERALRRLDGRDSHVLSAAIALDEHDYLLLIVDLTERVAVERALKHLALHDPTTGVPNRRLLMDRLEHALTRGSREHSITGVLFCDLDGFKHVNDTYGHRIGDLVLQTTAARLQSVLREHDTVARVGGDEFVVLLEQLSDATDAARLAERARIAIHEPMDIDSRPLRITASIGVAISCAGSDANTVLRCADDAMYFAKQRGRDQVRFAVETL